MPTQPKRTSRLARRIAGGACVGMVATSALVLVDYLGTPSSWTWPVEVALLNLLGSVPELTFRPGFFLFVDRGYLYLLPLPLLLVWPPTRRFTATLLAVILWSAAAWVAAMACALVYVLDRDSGVLVAPAALLIAALLWRWRRWRFAASLILAAGLALGTLLAQGFYAFPFQDDYPSLVSPLWGFVPPVALAAAVVLTMIFLEPRHPSRPSIVGLWGLTGVSLACALGMRAELRGVQARPADPPESRFLDDWAYDVHIVGDPPQLVWTDRRRIHVLTDAYGETHERYTVDDDEAYYVERIWSSPTGGIYIQGINKLEWWQEPERGERLSYRPQARYRSPEWLSGDSSSLWTIAEDPAHRRLFTISEYYSRYGVLDRDSGELVDRGVLSGAMWPFWHFTSDPDGRVLYATSALDDGGLYVMDLDTLAVEQKADHLYLYETILDPLTGLLWGVRPLTGEVVAVETETYEMRHRIPVEFGLRDLQRDPESGDMYTCSEIFGGIFRIDGRTHAVRRLGWCGRLCRAMHLDTERDALWVATRDGICRLGASGAPE